VLSLFERHTELIERGRREKPVEFGHKVLLSAQQPAPRGRRDRFHIMKKMNEAIDQVRRSEGSVRIFVSAEQGTLFAGEFRQPALEHDGEVVQRLFPVPNRHRPSLRRLANRHVNQLHC